MIKHFLFTIFMLLMFAACVSEEAKLSPISKIAADFSTGSGTSFAGGLLVVGVRKDANEKVSFAFPDGNPTAITMERGDWDFYSFGYSGSDGDLRDGKFAGLVECGLSTVSIRGGERKTINLNLSTDGCSGKLARKLKPQKFYVDTCPSFSYYDNTTFKFIPSALGNPLACFNQPEDQNSNVTYYKIFALNSNNGVVSESFSTPCLDEVALGTYPRKIPTDIAPLKIKIYRSLAACNGDSIAHNTFYYPNGILAGNALSFDSLLAENFSPGSSRLYLPEAHTKRLSSPFLNNIPRIICDTPDCFTSPGTDGRTASVDWDKPSKDQLIIPDINGNYTCDDFSHYSNGFGFSDCKIRNNSLYATVARNLITCQDPAVARAFKDLNERNGIIYALFTSAGSTYLTILSDEGQLLSSIDLGGDLNYSHVTATDSGDIFVANPVLGIVTPLKRTGPKSWTVQANITLADAGIIEVTADGKYLFHSAGPGYRVHSYNLVTHTPAYTMSGDLPAYVQKIQYSNGKLYVHVTDDPSNDPTVIYRYGIDDGDLQYETVFAGGGINVSFHINKGLLNYLTPAYNVGTQRNYENASDYTELVGVNGPTAVFAGPVDDMIVVNNTAYGIKRNSTDLFSLQWAGGLFVQPTVTANECADTFSVLLGGNVVGSHKIVSKLVPDDLEMGLQIFEAGNKLLGKKSADNKTYFKSLHDEQSRNTSGGSLSLAQRLLGPQGAGGMLSEYADCNALKTVVQVGTLFKTVGVTDPYRGYQSFTVRVKADTDTIPKFICNDGMINDASCTNQYELKVSVASTGLFERETYHIKLHCTSLVGQIDYRNTNIDSVWKQQLYWNTSIPPASRVDNYKMVTSDDHDIYETSQVFATGSFIRARAVRKDFWADYNTATIYDYQKNLINDDHYARKIYLGGAGSSVPTNYAVYSNESDYTGNAQYCLDSTESNPATASVGLCLFNSVLTDRVKQPGPGSDPSLSLSALENQLNFENFFDNFP